MVSLRAKEIRRRELPFVAHLRTRVDEVAEVVILDVWRHGVQLPRQRYLSAGEKMDQVLIIKAKQTAVLIIVVFFGIN